MTTDLDRFLSALKDLGVKWGEKTDDRFCSGPVITVENQCVIETDHDPGYQGFVSSWYFNIDGAFVSVGHWE